MTRAAIERVLQKYFHCCNKASDDRQSTAMDELLRLIPTPSREDYRIIPLSLGFFAKVDPIDYERVGCLRWFISNNDGKLYAKHTASRNKMKGDRAKIYMHRFILNAPIGSLVDHINGDTLDNRRENLRLVDAAMNTMNGKIRTDNTSGHRGVCWEKRSKRWKMQFKFRSTRIVKTFLSKEDAVFAYHELLPFPCPYCAAPRPTEPSHA